MASRSRGIPPKPDPSIPKPPTCKHDRLTFGCDGCIHRRVVDQLHAELVDMPPDELVERAAAEHRPWAMRIYDKALARVNAGF